MEPESIIGKSQRTPKGNNDGLTLYIRRGVLGRERHSGYVGGLKAHERLPWAFGGLLLGRFQGVRCHCFNPGNGF